MFPSPSGAGVAPAEVRLEAKQAARLYYGEGARCARDRLTDFDCWRVGPKQLFGWHLSDSVLANDVEDVEAQPIGFDPETAGRPDSLGLQGMRERAINLGGYLSVESLPAQGTTVALVLP